MVQVFFVRDGKMIGREHFRVSASTADNNYQIIGSFVKQFYAGTPFIPREIWVQENFPEMDLIAEWLTKRRGQAVKFLVPKKGQKERLVELAEKNAKLVLDQDKDKIKREELRTIGAMNQVGEWLGLGKVRRMEAYDISNISGFESVGSMVVFEDGRPKRNDYRKFKIRTVQGPNDYASMEEVLTRPVYPRDGGAGRRTEKPGRRRESAGRKIRKLYEISGSDPHGRRTRTGEYRTEGPR